MSTEKEVQCCKICGEPLDQGCRPLKTTIDKTKYFKMLTPQDLKEIDKLYRMVYLPTMHSYLARAEERSLAEAKTNSKGGDS